MFKEEDIVFSYTTKMAVEDGVLIPIPGIISQIVGIKYPVYFNDSVGKQYVDADFNRHKCWVKTAEISRILQAFLPVAKKTSSNICYFDFVLPSPIFLTDQRNEILNPDGSITASLKAVVSAEDIDKPSPAIFFMLPWED